MQGPLTALAILLAPLAVAPYELPIDERTRALLVLFAWVGWGAFALILAAQMAFSPDRTGYLRRHWSDLVLVLVPAVVPLAGVRFAFPVKPQTLAVCLGVAAGLRGLLGLRRALRHHGIIYILTAAALVVGIAADLVLEAERANLSAGQGNGNAAINTYGDALWWTFATVTSVGYGDRYPQSALGRGIGIGLMVLGIALFGVVTARLASFFVESEETNLERQIGGVDARLRAIEDALGKQASRQRSLADRALRMAKRTRVRRRKDRPGSRGARGNGAAGDAAPSDRTRPQPRALAAGSEHPRDRADRHGDRHPDRQGDRHADRQADRDARRAARHPVEALPDVSGSEEPASVA